MAQENFDSENLHSSKFDSFSKEDFIKRQLLLEEENLRLVRENYELRQIHLTDEQLKLITAEQIAALNETLYGVSSERYKKPENKKKPDLPPKPRVKKPSERYPNIPVREVAITVDPLPSCGTCGKVMSDSGMTEDSEVLTVIPKKFEITKYMRSIYRCTCQSCMVTVPVPPKIVEGSSYSNEMILDIVISKYCDLIPMERYVQMAARSGLMDLPPHSLIDLTHKFADFVKEVYRLIKSGILKASVLHADETPHRMLEGSDKKSWYLWGFSTPSLCYLECHDTRSGDVASDVLLNSFCEFLVTDVYSGYGKALKTVNLSRQLKKQLPIESAYCNAHARRYFYKPRLHYPEAKFYLDHYHEIYQLNDLSKGKTPEEVVEFRAQMAPRFEAMKKMAMEELARYPKGNQYRKALNYFLENYDGLTLFLTEPGVPIDNNAQERLLRSHVVGRKTWYGTHSERGAETAAILFSIVETCKLNQVNSRKYFAKLTEDLLHGKPAYTPVDFKNQAR
ncbi:MAG: IS66 family transposase [Bacteriovoracia bacterium]